MKIMIHSHLVKQTVKNFLKRVVEDVRTTHELHPSDTVAEDVSIYSESQDLFFKLYTVTTERYATIQYKRYKYNGRNIFTDRQWTEVQETLGRLSSSMLDNNRHEIIFHIPARLLISNRRIFDALIQPLVGAFQTSIRNGDMDELTGGRQVFVNSRLLRNDEDIVEELMQFMEASTHAAPAAGGRSRAKPRPRSRSRSRSRAKPKRHI